LPAECGIARPAAGGFAVGGGWAGRGGVALGSGGCSFDAEGAAGEAESAEGSGSEHPQWPQVLVQRGAPSCFRLWSTQPRPVGPTKAALGPRAKSLGGLGERSIPQ